MHEVSAREEFAKNPDLKQEDLTTLQAWLDTQKHLPAITDEMLILFLHSCYFDIEKTKDCIETYYTMRTHTPEFFTNRDISSPSLTNVLDASNFAVLPLQDPNGYQILYHGMKQCANTKRNYRQVEGLKLMIMTIDSLLLSSGTSNGLVIVMDMQEIKLADITSISLSALRKYFKYLQEANPVRLKAVHTINVVPYISTVLKLIKPFLKQELTSLLHFHTNGLDSLYEYIPKNCLPNDLGGELESIEELNAKNNIRLQSLAEHFAKEERLLLVETRREKGKRNKGKDLETVAFEKLDTH